MKNDFQDRIDEYILNKMTDEDKAQFEAEISSNKSKKELLEFSQNVKNAIASRESKLARMKVMQATYDCKQHQAMVAMRRAATNDSYLNSVDKTEGKSSTKRILWWASGIAAVLIVGLFVLDPFDYNAMAPSGFSPAFRGNSDALMRGKENDFFDIDSPTINDTIPEDSTKIINQVIEPINE